MNSLTCGMTDSFRGSERSLSFMSQRHWVGAYGLNNRPFGKKRLTLVPRPSSDSPD
jgi:hypothetical protein